MSPTYFAISQYRSVWLFVCFDLPVETKQNRHDAAAFRKFLLEDGFKMLQWSVYIRPAPTHENMDVHVRRVAANVPPEGLVSIFHLTDKQFSLAHNLSGAVATKPIEAPKQLELF